MAKAMKVFEKQEMFDLMRSSFDNMLQEVPKTSRFREAMKYLEKAIAAKSPRPLVQLRDEIGRHSPAVDMINCVCSDMSHKIEVATNHEYHINGICHYVKDYETGELAEFVKSIELLVSFYAFNQDSVGSRIDIPYMVQKAIISDFKIFAQLPHRDPVEPEMLVYYRSLDDLARNKKTKSKAGKWFMANNLGIEKEALQFSQEWAASAVKPPRVFFLSELTDKGGLSEDNWEWVYKHTDGRTGSCMIKCPEIARVYADNEVLDMAYVTDTDEPFSGKVIARTIIRHDTKNYIRTYQADHKIGGFFMGYLNEKGFKENRDLKGVTVKKLFDPYNKNHLIMPYFDGSSQYAIGLKDNTTRLKVIDRVPQSKNKEMRKLEFYSGTSGGRVQVRHSCSHCGSFGSKQTSGYIRDESGKKKKVDVCNYCLTSFVSCDSTGEHYSLEHFKFYPVFRSDYSRLVSDAVQSEFTKITCPITLERVELKEMLGGAEDKEGNSIKDWKSLLVGGGEDVYTMNPVKTYQGFVSDNGSCREISSYLMDFLTKEIRERVGNFYSRRDSAMKRVVDTISGSSKAKGKRAFLTFLLSEKLITQQEHDSIADFVKIPELSVDLVEGSAIKRKFDEDTGEIVYTFSLSDVIKDKLWKPVLSEAEKLKAELDALLKQWNAVEVVVL